MNLLSTAITETKEGELLIVWGGRRIVSQCLVPPLIEGDEHTERVWKRRYRWDNGNMIITRIYDNYTKRQDYNAIAFGRNPAIIKDTTGRIWVGYRIPIISSQDPMGVLSEKYVIPQNIGTTAGLNFWQVLRVDDLSQLKASFPFDWQEQTAVPVGYPDILLGQDYEDLGSLYEKLSSEQQAEETEEINQDITLEMFTDWTEDRITGDLYLRGMGGNLMDMENIERIHWNANEGLGRTWTSGIIDNSGRQVRLSINGGIVASLNNEWKDTKTIWHTQNNYGNSGCLRMDNFGQLKIAGYKEEYGEIPFTIEDTFGVRTEFEQNRQEEYAEKWAEDNEKKWVIENAGVPGEGYFSWEEPPSPEEQETQTKLLAEYYYALPTIGQQKVGFVISQTGLVFLSWMHGNLTAVEKDNGTYKAVGLRIAVSRDEGRTFEPLIPERVNRFTQ
ncbi:MAG: hypothetical protein BWX89_01018 [candidate division TA06 bacterium ADurb.Bin131]|uniref:Uncharacterized protein n=1 Tax=candidate division TA06 bacterium ADurb.Bin131 TaxID=1852827 RepID=A0A1V6C906_UNCT6|nr:MAG: hypothetical protein BWX89_01018 [candidate division TA06 bacterium ADurb.Bin131]